MGYNATVVVIVDALHEIENDPAFGRNLAQGIRELDMPRHGERSFVHVAARSHSNAAIVIEKHDADFTALIAVGGNLGSVLQTGYGYRHQQREEQVKLLRAWAGKLGFKLTESEAGDASRKPQEPA